MTYEKPTLYESLIEPLRREDASGLLRRFLERPQFIADETARRIQLLELTDDPATCPEELLPYLKDHVGFTKELDSITRNLDSGNLRRLIQLAIPLWKSKGTAGGLISVIRLLTGISPTYRDWFYLRYILGETLIAEEHDGTDCYMIGDSITELNEYYSNLRLMDDGLLDPQLVLDLVGLERPCSERIEIMLLDFLDSFKFGRNKWLTIEGTSSAPVTDGYMSLPPGQVETPIITDVPENQIYDYVLEHQMYLGAAGNKHDIYLSSGIAVSDEVVTYKLTLTDSGESWNIRLAWLAADDTETTVVEQVTVNGAVLHPETWYTVRVFVGRSAETGVNQIILWIDAIEQLNLFYDIGALTSRSSYGAGLPIASTAMTLYSEMVVANPYGYVFNIGE